MAWNIDSTVLAVWTEELPPHKSQGFVPKSYGKYHHMYLLIPKSAVNKTVQLY